MIAAIWWRAMEHWPVALCVAGLVAAALLLLYPPQIRRLSGWRRWMLPALRLTAMAALIVSILRPALVRDRKVQEQGTVLVLLDRSMSMSVLDRSLARPGDRRALIGQLVALADSLGRLPEGARTTQVAGLFELQKLEAMAEDIGRAWREAEFARVSGRQQEQATRRFEEAVSGFVSAARSVEQNVKQAAARAIVDRLASVSRMPKGDRRRWVEGLRAAVAQIGEDARRSQDLFDEELYNTNAGVRRACNELAGMSRLDLCWEVFAGSEASLMRRMDPQVSILGFAFADRTTAIPLRGASGPLQTAPAAGTGPSTDLIGGIAQALRQTRGTDVQAVLVFSDGRQVGGSGAALPPGILPTGVPVFTVYAASPSMRDLAIDRVEVPAAVFPGEPMSVRLALRSVNIDTSAVSGTASIALRGGPPTTRPLRIRPGRSVQLPAVRLSDAGLHGLTVKVSVQEGEADSENNQADAWVKVLEQRPRVALISSAPTWDHRCIRNALSRAGWVQLRDAIVPRSTALSMSRAEMLQQDLVILNDTSRDSLTSEQWSALLELVRVRGGSVIIIPGASFPQQQLANHVMQELLPCSSAGRPIWRTWLGQDPSYHLAPHPSAGNRLSLGESEAETEGGWDDLPGFFSYLELPQLKMDARPLLIERETGAPILVEQRLGSGRVFFFGMNETWRWRQRVGESDHERFWLQLARLGADEPYACVRGPEGQVLFDAEPLATEAGRTIQLRARLLLRGGTLPESLDVLVTREGAILQTAALKPVGEAGAGRYRGSFVAPDAGDYELKLIGPPPPDGGENIVPQLSLKVQPNPQEELANISGDREFLERLAESTGGQCLNLDQVGLLPQQFQQLRQRRSQTVEHRLWDSGYLFVFVLSCLSAEWALRKRFGLA